MNELERKATIDRDEVAILDYRTRLDGEHAALAAIGERALWLWLIGAGFLTGVLRSLRGGSAYAEAHAAVGDAGIGLCFVGLPIVVLWLWIDRAAKAQKVRRIGQLEQVLRDRYGLAYTKASSGIRSSVSDIG